MSHVEAEEEPAEHNSSLGPEINAPTDELLTELEEFEIPAPGKLDLFMVQIGVKPATELSYQTDWHEPGGIDPDVEGREKLAKIIMYLDKSGLPYSVKSTRSGKAQTSIVYIGRNQEDLRRIIEADNPMDEAKYGRAVGYPDTAVEGYINNDMLSEEEFNRLVPQLELNVFTGMRLSREHWREELDVVKARLDAVKRTSPIILGQYIEHALANQ